MPIPEVPMTHTLLTVAAMPTIANQGRSGRYALPPFTPTIALASNEPTYRTGCTGS